MPMTRRDWLTRVFGATVAAAIAPLVDLTDQTPEFWNQLPIRERMPWRIVFPDGTCFSFSAEVIGEQLTEDGVEFQIRPHGVPEVTVVEIPKEEEENEVRPRTATLSMPEGRKLEMTDIELPKLEDLDQSDIRYLKV